jgi:hypothetical protein
MESCVSTVFLLALFWCYCANAKLIATIFPNVKSCCFIADKVKLPVAFDRRQARGPYIRAVMDSRLPARKSSAVPDSGVWGTTQVLTPTEQEHRNVLQWSTEIL